MLRVRTVWTGIPGAPFLTTTFHAGGVADAQTAVDKMFAYWEGIRDDIATAVIYSVSGIVDEVNPADGAIIDRVGVTGDQNSGAEVSPALLSLGTCGLVNLHSNTFVGGREVRGKLYIPAPTENQMNVGLPTSGYGDLISGAAMTALVETSGFGHLGIYSRTNGNFYDVEAFDVSTYFARLRSRQS